MTTSAARVPLPRRSRRGRRLRVLLGALLAAVLAGTVIAWLQTTGTSQFTIPPAAGTSNGQVVDVVPMSTPVTRTNGAALLQVGVGLAKLEIAKDFPDDLRITVAGTNLYQADQVSNNPNSRFSIGLYHPIHTGNCSTTDNSVDAPRVNIDDPEIAGTADFCAVLAPSPNQATGSGVSESGKLLLAKNFQAGYLRPRLAAPASPGTCGSTIPGGASDVNDPWCQPASAVGADQRVLYLIASIVTPGGIPQGQQTNLNQLTFYIEGKRATAGT